MNRLLRDLHILMERKIVLYDQFILLLQEQWDSITEYSLNSLQEIMEKKETLVEEMQGLEKERTRLMQKIERTLGVTQPGTTLKQLIETTKDPIRAPLAKCRETLLGQIMIINKLHEQVKGLMDHSSLSMKKSLAFIHSQSEAATSPYHANGRVLERNLQGKMLSLDA